VYVNFSQPISVKDFLLENPQTENEKVKIVTLKFEQLLKEQMLFIPAETLPVFNLITGSQPSKANTSTYAFLKSIADQLHTLVTFQKKCYQKVEITYEGLKKEWAQTGLKEHLVIHKNRTWYQHLLLTFPFAPIAVIVLLLNAPPLLLSKIIVKRIVKNPNFKASAALAMGTLFVLLNSVLLFCIVYITLNIYAAIFFILILFPALRYSLKMLDFFQEGFRDLLDLKIFIFKHYLFKKLMVRQKKLLYTFKGA
jgi:hypothetical protein